MLAERITLLFFFIFSFSFSQNESPFKLNKTTDLTLSTFGIVSISSAYLIKKNSKPLSFSKATSLNAATISAFDRSAVNYHSNTALHLSDVGQYMALTLPLSIFAFQPSKKELITQLIMLQEVAMITIGLTHLTKGLVLRSRPYVYRSDASLELKQNPDSRTSFFSGHTAITSAMTFYTASVIATYSGNRALKTFSWIGASILPLSVGYLRVRAGKHFHTDVLMGFFVGGGVGWLIPKLHLTKKTNIQLYPYFTPETNGVSFCLNL